MRSYALFAITPTLAPGKVQLLQRVCLQCLRRVSVFQDSVFEMTSLQKLNLFQIEPNFFRLCGRQQALPVFVENGILNACKAFVKANKTRPFSQRFFSLSCLVETDRCPVRGVASRHLLCPRQFKRRRRSGEPSLQIARARESRDFRPFCQHRA